MWQADRPSLGNTGDQIARVIGYAAAVRLIDALPPAGKRPWRRCLYVPVTVPHDHFLVSVIGWPLAMRLAAEFGGMILQPSNGAARRRQQIARAVRASARAAPNATSREIAAQLNLPVSTVRYVLREQGQSARGQQ